MRTSTSAGVAAALLLSLAACTLPGAGSGSSPPPPSTTTATSPDQAPSSASTSASATASPGGGSPSTAAPTPAGTVQPAGPDQLGEVVATRTGSKDGSKIQLQLHPVLRDGSTAHVNVVLESEDPVEDRIQIGTMFSDGDREAADSTGFSVDGFQLVDGKNSKLHLVASDGAGHCLCTRSTESVFLRAGAPLILSATFAAPPVDVAAVDVRIPGFGTVRGVPVQ